MRHLIFVLFSLYSLAAWAKPDPVTWEKTIESAVPNIVATCVVGTAVLISAPSSVTGFVVDKERGLLLTNRHMVHGVVVAEAVFSNHEDPYCASVYRDPVRFDFVDLIERRPVSRTCRTPA